MTLNAIDRGVAVVLAVAAATVVVAGFSMRGDAGVFPIITGGLGVVACIALAVRTFRHGGSTRDDAREPFYGRRFALWSACVVVLLVLIEPLGTFVALPLFLAASMLLLARLRLRAVVAVSLAFTVVIYVTFAHLLEVPLPAGVLAPWLNG